MTTETKELAEYALLDALAVNMALDGDSEHGKKVAIEKAEQSGISVKRIAELVASHLEAVRLARLFGGIPS
jgi:predicted HTH domain antitoxin